MPGERSKFQITNPNDQEKEACLLLWSGVE